MSTQVIPLVFPYPGGRQLSPELVFGSGVKPSFDPQPPENLRTSETKERLKKIAVSGAEILLQALALRVLPQNPDGKITRDTDRPIPGGEGSPVTRKLTISKKARQLTAGGGIALAGLGALILLASTRKG